jgi:hypothetical protein
MWTKMLPPFYVRTFLSGLNGGDDRYAPGDYSPEVHMADSHPASPSGPTTTPAANDRTPARRPGADEIARRAYQLYEERGRDEGRDLDDWLRAEDELRRR